MKSRRQFDSGVDASRNDTALKRAEPGRLRVRSLVARGLTVVLLAAFAALLAPPPVVQAQTAVPPDWSLIPSELGPSDTFRLVFLSSTKRNASSTDIADYNTFVQDRAAAGHVDIQAYSSGFRAVGCTADTDALDNTATNYTASDKGVPIYWLNGAKADDDYEDFYDGSWDEEVNDKNESGNDGPDTSLDGNHPFTGCEHDGTEAFFAGNSRAPGNNGQVYVGVPDSIGANNGPIGGTQTTDHSNTRPLYGLSEVFQVSSAATVTVERNVGFTVTVDDDPDKSVRKQLIQVPEGGSREYQINMTQAPTQGVRVSYRFQGRDSSISSATPRSHTFTAQNWETPWRITVDAAQDSDTFDGMRTIQHEVETDDPFYKRKSPRFVHIAEQDDDTDANGRVSPTRRTTQGSPIRSRPPWSTPRSGTTATDSG